MKTRCVILTASLGLAVCTQAPAGEAIELFNGKDLKGWSTKGGDASFVVEDGAILGTSKPNTPNTFLCPDKKFGDFELTFEVKCDAALNSGVQIRSIDSPDDVPKKLEGKEREKAEKRTGSGSLCGPQVEIAANGNAGGVYFEGVGGWTLDPNKEAANKAYKKDGWNAYRVVAKGNKITVWINGTKIVDGEEKRSNLKKGFLGFQVHGVGKKTEPLRVRWKNIKIKEL